MSDKNKNDQLSEVGDSIKSLIEKGNARHIVIRNEVGEKIAEFNLTVAAIGAFVLFFMMPFSWVIVMAAVVYGIVKKVRIEVVSEISDNDDSIQMDLD